MSTAIPLPDARAVGEFLRKFIATAPSIEKSKQNKPPPTCSLAIYALEGSPHALVWGTDLVSSARMAAGLSMLPEGVVDDTLRAKRLTEPLRENLYEVFNVALSLFSDGARRVRMHEVHYDVERRFRDATHTQVFDLKWQNGVTSTTFFVLVPAASLLNVA